MGVVASYCYGVEIDPSKGKAQMFGFELVVMVALLPVVIAALPNGAEFARFMAK